MNNQKSTTDRSIQSTARSMLVREDFAVSVQEAMLKGRAHWVVDILEEALAEDDTLWPAWGLSLLEALVLCGRRDKAHASVARWQALYPFDVLASMTRAELLSHAGWHARAIEVLQAITLHAVSAEMMPELLLIRGQIARRNRAFDQAQRAFSLAYEQFASPRAALAIGELFMLQADYPRGFQWLAMQRALTGRFGEASMADHALERLRTGAITQAEPIWVLFHQGLGDCLQLMRFVAPLMDQGLSLVLHVPALLCAELQKRFPSTRCEARENVALPQGQAWLSSWDLPLLEPRHWYELPAPFSFSRQPQGFRPPKRIGEKTSGAEHMPLRIGLCWRGSSHSLADRSVPFELMVRLLSMPSVSWVCLQADLLEEEHATWKVLSGREPEQFQADQNFEALLAAVQQVDMVICIDSFIAHLAACESKPTLCLLPAVDFWPWSRHFDQSRSEWRALLSHVYRHMPGEPTPWYPGMCLLRQKVIGSWDEPFEDVERFVSVSVAMQ